jgi:mannobiose 2-epimerase
VIDQADLSRRALAELTQNILPFWSTVAVDLERGGFHGSVSNDLQIDDSVERTAVVCARVLWSFSVAARTLGDPQHLRTADHAYAYLVRHFVDPVHGGIYWSVDADGIVVDERKQTYAQAFAVYALAEYARSRAGQAPLGLAFALIELIERDAADHELGGYFEARSREWSPVDDVRLSPKDLNAPKSMNTLLHVMEAYTTVVEVTGDESVRGRLAALTTTILDEVVDQDTGSFRLFFDDAWHPVSTAVSYGHDIEGGWLLVAAARAVGDAALVERAEQAAVDLADAVYRDGRDELGAVLYEHRPASAGVPAHTDRDSHWWAQAEGAVGFLDAYRITGELRFLEAAGACWDVISTYHIDRVHGDWFKVLDPQRRPRPTSPKVGPWECPYHHVRACLELIRRLPVAPTRKEGPTR